MSKTNSKYTIFTLIVATILWYLLFVIKPMNFWLEMSLSISALVLMAFIFNKDIFKLGKLTIRHILIGIFSAIALYIIFYLGNIVSGFIFPFKDSQVLSVYSNRSNGNLIWIGLLLLFIIGPGEEIYWRGFIQNTLSKKIGETKGYVISVLLYAGVHIITVNVMLVIAALVCGVFWGWLYKKEKSLLPVIISHAIWDLTIFVIFPLI
ncbi:CPBP family intramembrane metalloprotease [Clostridium estertheticum]|uniref:CPBP family intramembrane glutamic endopeptidase n=1 Tax=Clostridium estertheticum TaxID=238834 RepID=UPI00209A6BB9|nr:type II CAAX endopeptidase family protein [Clostridium estertheticum]WAG56982.1 CPBP family intramembrane metalloprotease [Clostridium estertheticum]